MVENFSLIFQYRNFSNIEELATVELKKKQDNEAAGEIETAHPGYLGSQDTFYVGILKGVGRIYQQPFVDTYSKATSVHNQNADNSGRPAQ